MMQPEEQEEEVHDQQNPAQPRSGLIAFGDLRAKLLVGDDPP
jgi:hypothetical protein